MKIYKDKIYAASNPSKGSGTVFYAATLDQIIQCYQDYNKNAWVRQAFIENGFDALELESNLYGSAIFGDTLYICVTDGKDIIIQGKPIFPEDAFDLFDVAELSEYIEPADDAIISRYITEYEIQTPNFDDWATDVLNDGYDFTKLVKDYQEFDSL